MSRLRVAFIAAVLLVIPCTAPAQGRIALELIPGAAFPVQTLAGSDLDTGFGAGINVSVRIFPNLSPYVGWDWRRFRAPSLFAGNDIDIEETGYAFGLRLEQPITPSGPSLMLRGGGTYNHIELEDSAGNAVDDSGHGFGWEAAAGISLPLGDQWAITPGVRYRSLDREFGAGSGTTPVTLRYVALEVGFTRRF